MTAADIPDLDTLMTSNQGGEGIRFVGFALYDGLTSLDLDQGDDIPTVEPGLATSWEINDDATEFTFTLREGVTFTDGTPWDADAAIYNLERYTDPESDHYYEALAATSSFYVGSISSVEKLDDMTVVIRTAEPSASLPASLALVFMGSPTAIEELGNEGFSEAPVGTGPFVYDSSVRGQELVMKANAEYWDGAPGVDSLILKPLSDSTARSAALRSGEVDWIEAPIPDDISGLEDAGFDLYTNSYDHTWVWQFDTEEGPFSDPLVRQAANYAIDRDAIVSLLQDTAEPLEQVVPTANTAYRSENDLYTYDPAKAQELLAQAGYADGVEATVVYPTSGSGMMQPQPMMEALQRDLAEVGIDVTLEPMEWGTMLDSIFSAEIPNGADAVANALGLDPVQMWTTVLAPTGSINVGGYNGADIPDLVAEAEATVDDEARADLYAEAGAIATEDAPWLFVVSDLNPRMLAGYVDGFVQPQSWWIDLTTITVD